VLSGKKKEPEKEKPVDEQKDMFDGTPFETGSDK